MELEGLNSKWYYSIRRSWIRHFFIFPTNSSIHLTVQVNSLLQSRKQLCQQKLKTQYADGDPLHSHCHGILLSSNTATKSYYTLSFSLSFVTLPNLMKILCEQKSPNSISRSIKRHYLYELCCIVSVALHKSSFFKKQLKNFLV